MWHHSVIIGNVNRTEINFDKGKNETSWVHWKMKPYQAIGGLYGSSKVKGGN